MMIVLTIAARWIVGVVLLRAGAAKLLVAAGDHRVAISEYGVLPKRLEGSAALVLPWLEIGLALMLMAGIGVLVAGVVAAVLLASFSCAITVNLARGRVFDCGCGGSARRRISWSLVGWDLLLAGGSTLVAAAPNAGLAMSAGWGAHDAAPPAMNLLPIPMLVLVGFIAVVLVRRVDPPSEAVRGLAGPVEVAR